MLYCLTVFTVFIKAPMELWHSQLIKVFGKHEANRVQHYVHVVMNYNAICTPTKILNLTQTHHKENTPGHCLLIVILVQYDMTMLICVRVPT
jgi:hypothetical protein